MNIAKVIVDVPASLVNQTFDYAIPEKFQSMIKPGMRVIVPFGPRKITGFVIKLSDHAAYAKVKEIIDVLDMTPVLTEELLQLGSWLADETLSLYITTYQAMLPQVLKAKYEKHVEKLVTDVPILNEIFQDKTIMDYEELVDHISYRTLQAYIEKAYLTVEYKVKAKEAKKYATVIQPADKSVLEAALLSLHARATKQKEMIEYFIAQQSEIRQEALYQILQINRTHIKTLLDKGLIFEKQVEVYRNPYEREFPKTENLPLTEEQSMAIAPVLSAIEEDVFRSFLLHGVTGSGKTEIYLQAIERVIAKGKEAIVLVPEIALTPQMVERFKGRFGANVAVMHSALSIGEKYDEWRKIQRKEVQVVVGARSAIFAPFENLGIIIIDEEHETTYKQEESPRYHARDVAMYRGKYNHCPVVLGSATPALESYARGTKDVYKLLEMKQRTNKQAMPAVSIIDMRQELRAGNRTMFATGLMDKMRHRIAKGEQIVLLLNRRGYSNFALCRDCGHVEQCPNCDISLTYHKREHRLKCHYCSHEMPMPLNCPACESDLFRFFGTGTQRVEEALTKLMPEASIIRMDVDTTRRKGAHERLLSKFAAGEANILLGTQMIAKGLDFENVTLVGVLAADAMLHLPDFRAAEKTFQLITQVSGRAGRHALQGEVVVQTYTPDHYSITCASEHDYKKFYEREMQLRQAFRYPPYVYLVLITVTDEDESKVVEVIQNMSVMLQTKIQRNSLLLGPTPSPIKRIKNRYRYQLVIKYKSEPTLPEMIQEIKEQFTRELKKGLQIIVDFHPTQLM